MTWILWPIGAVFAIVLAAATWLTADTVRMMRHAKRVQDAINRDGR